MTSLVLASGSAARARILKNAGLAFQVAAADIDESRVQSSGLDPREVADELARAKALHVAARHPGALVIGADQVLYMDGRLFTKAGSGAEAKRTLAELSGRAHTLRSSVAIARDAEILWSHAAEAHMHMHDFDGGFLDAYMRAAGPALTRSVGCYEYEGAGAWLFDKIEGDYFTVLGLPLLPLLGFLKTQGFGP